MKNKTKEVPVENAPAIRLTHKDVQIEITFLDEPPKENIKETITEILSAQSQNKVMA